MFYSVRNLTGSITSTLFNNSLGTLKNVQNLFAFTNMTNVESGFLYRNRKIKSITRKKYK